MNTYDKAEAMWWKGRREFLKPHELRAPYVTAKGLLNELHALARETKDPRFQAAVNALHEREVIMPFIDDGTASAAEWMRPPVHVRRAERFDMHTLHDWVKEEVNRGHSMRASCAFVAAMFGVYAASFEAAVKRVHRIFDEIELDIAFSELSYDSEPTCD